MFSTPICLQQQCVEKSAFILNKMETNADPCKDFYKYMCGSAREVPPNITYSTPVKNTTENPLYSESIFKYMVRKVSNYAGATRTGALSTANSLPLYHESILAKFFTMCERVEKTSDQATVEDVKSKLQLLVSDTGMSLRDLFNPKKFNNSFSAGGIEYRLRIAGFPGRHFFDSEIKRDHLDPENLALYIGRAKSFISVSASDLDVKDRGKWRDTFKMLIQYFIPSTEDADISLPLLSNIIELWFDMRDIVNTTEDKKVKDQAVRVDELRKQFPFLDFRDLLSLMGAPEKSTRYIYMKSGSQNYFAALKRVLDKKVNTRQVQVGYLVYQSMWDVVPFLSFDSYRSGFMDGIGSLNSQNDLCKNLLGNRFGGMVLSLVIERFELERNPPDILNKVFSYFVNVMNTWLDKSSWMDSKTKEGGNAKLKAMKKQISLSKKQYDSIKTPGKRAKFYNGLCMQRSVLTTLLCMNRFFARKNFGLFNRDITGFDEADSIAMGDVQYHQEINTFEVPIFILRFPAFDNNWPLHVNFGGLGVEIGAAITDGFDLGGSRRDKFGIENSWWTSKTLENYKKREFECSRLMQPIEKKSKALSNVTNSKSLTLQDLNRGELTKSYWKSLLGIKMAFKAYMDYRDKQPYRGKVLPGLEMYSHEQNFFFSHAHMRCLPPMPPKELKLNTTVYFQALSELAEFKKAFGCSSRKSTQMAGTVKKATGKCSLF